MAARTFLGMVRLWLLVGVLVFVALGAWLDRSRTRDWNDTLRITVYPIAQSTDPSVRNYSNALQATDFASVEAFFRDEAQGHGVALEQPVRVRVSQAAHEPPPQLDGRPGMLGVMLWSLKLRYYAARVAWNDPLPAPHIQVFALYSPMSQDSAPMPDSVGLSKGLIAVAHLYGHRDASGSNQVVVAHEVLHTLGATDKYDLATGQPLAPTGLGEPELDPRYPQQFGEIMAGRVATSARDAIVPASLDAMLVGPQTAREIGWIP